MGNQLGSTCIGKIAKPSTAYKSMDQPMNDDAKGSRVSRRQKRIDIVRRGVQAKWAGKPPLACPSLLLRQVRRSELVPDRDARDDLIDVFDGVIVTMYGTAACRVESTPDAFM